MQVSHNKRWKLLIDLKIGKAALRHRTGVVSSTFTKLSNNQEVSMSFIRKICEELNCDIGVVMEFQKTEIYMNNLQQSIILSI